MNTPSVALEGEVSRALTLGGLTFSTALPVNDGQSTRTFSVPYERDGLVYTVTAYVVAPRAWVALCGLRQKVADDSIRLRFSDEVSGSIPMVRLALDTMQPGTVWLQSLAILPSAPSWSHEMEDTEMVTAPIFAVSNAAHHLLTRYTAVLEYATGVKIPLLYNTAVTFASPRPGPLEG